MRIIQLIFTIMHLLSRYFTCALLSLGTLVAAPLGIMVPAYFYPGALWNKLNVAAGRVPLTAIMNPNSGPRAGYAADFVNYNQAILALQAAGGKVIGYVYTGYGNRPIAEVKADIDFYQDHFTRIDGFFLDEMTQTPNAAQLTYYRELYTYIGGKSSLYRVTGNPGSYYGEIYLQQPHAVDTLVTYEQPTGYSGAAPPSWVFHHLARNFSHIPYNVAASATMEDYVRLAKSRNTGLVYVTDDVLNNPWDTLPTYWEREVQLVKELNAAELPTRLGPLTRQGNGSVNLPVNGSPGVFEVHVSSNLRDWSILETTFTATGSFTVSDAGAAGQERRFYRTAQ
jgi:hypothetical protein